jgi:hypothetical protein
MRKNPSSVLFDGVNMVLLWVIQLIINVLLVTFIFVWWRERALRKMVEPSTENLAVNVLHSPVGHWEKEILLYKKKNEDQLKTLSSLCEKAQAILTQHASEALSPSSEEEELRSLKLRAPFQTGGRSIPSVQELEIRKQAVKTEIPFDLRSLLRDQLS